MCLGNICRSPTAEAVFRAVVQKKGLADSFDIDSCGTGGGSSSWYQQGGFSYHEGDEADPRMTSVASKRGVRLTSRSRPLKPGDFKRFDVILGMENKNVVEIEKAAKHWQVLSPEAKDKIGLLPTYCQKEKCSAVPDPWYDGSEEAFNKVLDLVEDACEGLVEDLCLKHGLTPKA